MAERTEVVGSASAGKRGRVRGGDVTRARDGEQGGDHDSRGGAFRVLPPAVRADSPVYAGPTPELLRGPGRLSGGLPPVAGRGRSGHLVVGARSRGREGAPGGRSRIVGGG